MFNITNQIIANGCSRHNSLSLGEEYYNEGAVRDLEFISSFNAFRGYVRGGNNYRITIVFNEQGSLKDYICSCPDYQNYPSHFCKHLVAGLLAIKNIKSFNPELRNAQEVTENLFHHFASKTEEGFRQVLDLEVVLNYQEIDDSNEKPYLEFKIGFEKLYVVKNVKRLVEAMQTGKNLVFGKNFTFYPLQNGFKPDDNFIIEMLKDIYDIDEYKISSYEDKKGSLFSGKKVYLSDSFLEKFIDLREDNLIVNINGINYDQMPIIDADLPINFQIEKEQDRLRIQSDILSNILALTTKGSYFFYAGKLYRPSKKQIANIMPLYRSFKKSISNSLLILPEYKEKFISEILPELEKAGDVDVSPNLEEEIVKIPFNSSIYLDIDEGTLWAEIKFIYGKWEINPFSNNTIPTEGFILVRDMEKEKRIMALLERTNFRVSNLKIYLDDEDKIFEFLTEIIPELRESANVYYSSEVNALKMIHKPVFTGQVSLNNNIGMLDFSFKLEGIEREELYDILAAYKEKKKYYRLRDGSFMLLQEENFGEVSDIVNLLGLKKKDLLQEVQQIPKYRAMYFDGLMEKQELGFLNVNNSFRELTKNIKNPEDLDFPFPKEVEGLLRDYQKKGYKWLKTLAHYGFGGILADDMGLGKTLQSITYILSEQKENTEPVLVIVPTSLLYNWQMELEQFAPSMKTRIISGSRNERRELLDNLEEVDLVITSYPLVQRDIEEYLNYNFSYCIIDEAQYIKNPHSQRAKAVKMIKAKNYLALTGTPIENSLIELWSIFDFIMPGYLPAYTEFTRKYLNPIEKEGDAKATNDLAKLVRPFILRRVKEDVLKELPAKIENKMISELTLEQKKIYLAYLEKISKEITDDLKEKGLAKSRIKILAGLTRLRQICCHPGLFLDNYTGDSGKLEQLKEVLQEIIGQGHRVLIFSQFTSMLAIISEMLDRENYKYLYIDGSVKAMERMVRVSAFNEGEGDIFLISLKAGGTGLNLTGADVVIHFDPWWNPAVEDQASDRAHRFGQEKVVQVLKFIAKGTIEEKIYKLQLKKKELIDKLIEPGETMLSSLSEQEIYDLLEI
ncbi:Superfamily II DNA or RNA helicase, SNF2 family [Desulfonispora thiosulfatigenes DSM 11270]|uniref:Superfamily II DNA or RNA helicase, SNF2 family n=1 Tax=Desulfonispora thiosulfatigenes DSM 11270 TaxID=656914 RepID=A0A1W1VD50_DESTI|nr:SNF2 helicase associated domain-containing protein [Desulfonispora thiosulfatigenes]SMB91329.1 Superfamily II DNA or RNA helicase, SNF2 family [Desulfonispora thiosulfatigenes DSM 11270]